MAAPAAEERLPGLIHHDGQIRRRGGHRERARLDVRGVKQVADQRAHLIGLLVDDAEQLHCLGRVQRRGGPQHRGRAALDRGQRGPQLVAHHAEELGPQPLQLLHGRHVLQRDDERRHLARLRPDRRGVDQRGHPPAVGELQDDLLGANRHRLAQHLPQGGFLQQDLPPVGPPHPQPLQQRRGRAARRAQVPDNPPRLPVQRHHLSAAGVEHHDAHRRGLDQHFQVRPRPLLVPVLAGIGDRRPGLRGERRQHLLVLPGERLASESAVRHAMPRSESMPSKYPINSNRKYVPGVRLGPPTVSA